MLRYHYRTSTPFASLIFYKETGPLDHEQIKPKLMKNPFIAELIGTMLLIIFGDGVVANVLLNKSKGQNSGWIVIATGWAMAVAVGVYASWPISGAHINPAVTIGLAVIGKFPVGDGRALHHRSDDRRVLGRRHCLARLQETF